MDDVISWWLLRRNWLIRPPLPKNYVMAGDCHQEARISFQVDGAIVIGQPAAARRQTGKGQRVMGRKNVWYANDMNLINILQKFDDKTHPSYLLIVTLGTLAFEGRFFFWLRIRCHLWCFNLANGNRRENDTVLVWIVFHSSTLNPFQIIVY